MTRFNGFPQRMQYTAVPNLFFSQLIPQIEDIDELKTTLVIFQVIYRKKGYPRFTTYSELAGNPALLSSLTGPEPVVTLHRSLDMAAARGTLLHLRQEGGGTVEDVYLLNSEYDRLAVARIQSGELSLGELKAPKLVAEVGTRPDVFTLYEQNIGMLTPLIADELRDAEKRYPESWLGEAIKEAANHNKRNISYILAILERWSTGGKGDGTNREDIEKTGTDRFIKGKYGHMVRR
jgi:DNA replication protein